MTKNIRVFYLKIFSFGGEIFYIFKWAYFPNEELGVGRKQVFLARNLILTF